MRYKDKQFFTIPNLFLIFFKIIFLENKFFYLNNIMYYIFPHPQIPIALHPNLPGNPIIGQGCAGMGPSWYTQGLDLGPTRQGTKKEKPLFRHKWQSIE